MALHEVRLFVFWGGGGGTTHPPERRGGGGGWVGGEGRGGVGGWVGTVSFENGRQLRAARFGALGFCQQDAGLRVFSGS